MCKDMDPFGWGNFDREETNESDGQHFWGSDNEDGTTDWYTDDGMLDSTTSTPSDDIERDAIFMRKEYTDDGEWIMPSPYLEDYVNDEEYMEGLINNEDDNEE